MDAITRWVVGIAGACVTGAVLAPGVQWLMTRNLERPVGGEPTHWSLGGPTGLAERAILATMCLAGLWMVAIPLGAAWMAVKMQANWAHASKAQWDKQWRFGAAAASFTSIATALVIGQLARSMV